MSYEKKEDDTFLSRVFGLHSVYNQLQENYQYYGDPEEGSYQEEEAESILLGNVRRTRPMDRDVREGTSTREGANSREGTNGTRDGKLDSKQDSPKQSTPNLLDSESDLEEEEEEILGLGVKVSRVLSPIPPAKVFTPQLKQDELPLFNQPAESFRKAEPKFTPFKPGQRFIIPPKERALYLWANIINMDEFLTDVYYYYRGNGILNIVVTRIVDLIILVFVLWFSVFLRWGINYELYLKQQHSTLLDLIVPGYIWHAPLFIQFLLLGFSAYIVLRLIQLYFDYTYKLREIKNFFTHLIGITNDDELMTISWKTIVERLMLLKDYNSLTSNDPLNDLNSKVRLNAHDIANRIMRKENYMIALINKDVLDFGSFAFLNNKSLLTKTLEWNLKLCINNFVFNSHGQINGDVLKDFNRNQMAKDLTLRFKMAAIINLLLCPFIVIYFVLLYFFRYFNEYKSNPSSLLGLRQYTPFAEWKLREFNELPHFFIRRLHLSIGPANTYINQFPRSFLIVNVMTLVNFVLGAMLAVLVIMGLWFEDEDHSFWSFEITEGKSALFFISMFGTIWAITTTATTNTTENLNHTTLSYVYDPEASLRYVSQFTHYLPSKWNGQLHSVQVKQEFCELYSLKIIIILHEILSLIMTPFILWFNVLRCSGAIIDFIRDFLIHVDGLGYVCYFAMFNFEEKDKNMMYDLNKRKNRSKPARGRTTAKTRNIAPAKAKNVTTTVTFDDTSESEEDLATDYYQDDKMIKSYMYFLESYGTNENEPVKQGTAKKTVFNQARPVTNVTNAPTMEDSYNIDYKFDEQTEFERNGHKSGVFGMINQFYKHDSNR